LYWLSSEEENCVLLPTALSRRNVASEIQGGTKTVTNDSLAKLEGLEVDNLGAFRVNEELLLLENLVSLLHALLLKSLTVVEVELDVQTLVNLLILLRVATHYSGRI